MRTNGLSQNDVYKKLNNILMLDEATRELDPLTQSEIISMLDKLKEKK